MSLAQQTEIGPFKFTGRSPQATSARERLAPKRGRQKARPAAVGFSRRWDNDDAFGGNVANQNPSGLGTFAFNLRFPGQYFDAETGNHYNYFRDYSPEIGRYVESDPIGLRGGLNTYGYVTSDPLTLTDPFGLYGTSNCNYYVQRCVESGGSYYCFWAKNACKYIPPLIRSGWTACVRQCLQEADEKVCRSDCSDSGSDVWCIAGAHKFCWYKCAVDPNARPQP